MGQAITHFFESKLAWSYDNGIFYINGRDIMCFITGFLACCIVVSVIMSISDKYAKAKKRKKKR